MSQRNWARRAFAVLVGALIAAGVPATSLAGFADLYVGVRNGSTGVVKIDGATGVNGGTFAASGSTQGVTFGPDGNFYAASFNADAVLRFDKSTGIGDAGPFTSGAPLGGNSGITFGPDGYLYATSFNGNDVLRFDGTTGAFDRVFATGVSSPYGLLFGPDGNLYVGDTVNNSIVRYNGTTGAMIDVFAHDPALKYPGQFAFGPDGNLYVSSFDTNAVVKFDGTSGVMTNPSFASVFNPSGLAFADNGDLFVASFTNGTINRYDGITGAFQSVLTSGIVGGPTFMTFGPAAVPEPSSVALTLLGGLFVAIYRRRRRVGL